MLSHLSGRHLTEPLRQALSTGLVQSDQSSLSVERNLGSLAIKRLVNCIDMQADLGRCCWNMSKGTVSHVATQNFFLVFSITVYVNTYHHMRKFSGQQRDIFLIFARK